MAGTQVSKPEPEDDGVAVEVANVHIGVTYTWLANNFKMSLDTVKRRLGACPVKGKRKNAPIYDLAQAAPYLVEPKVDIAEYIKSMRSSDLPPGLQKDYWDGQLKRIDYEVKAAQLWRTDDVFKTFAEAFKRIKTSVLLWRDTIDRADALSDVQKKILDAQVDSMLDGFYQELIQMSKKAKTQNVLQYMLEDIQKDSVISIDDPDQHLEDLL